MPYHEDLHGILSQLVVAQDTPGLGSVLSNCLLWPQGCTFTVCISEELKRAGRGRASVLGERQMNQE